MQYPLANTLRTNKTNGYQRCLVEGLGQWGVPSGQYFREWNEKKHLVKPFEIPREWKKFRAADFGIERRDENAVIRYLDSTCWARNSFK